MKEDGMVFRRLMIPSQGETGADLRLFHSRFTFRLYAFIYTSLNLSLLGQAYYDRQSQRGYRSVLDITSMESLL